MDDEGVEDGEGDDGPDPQEDLADDQVGLEDVGVGDKHVLDGLPAAGLLGDVGRTLYRCRGVGGGGGVAGVREDDLVLEAERDVEEHPAQEGEADADAGVHEGVDPLEVGGLVDGDVAVDRHEDDDVDTARHEAVDERHL